MPIHETVGDWQVDETDRYVSLLEPTNVNSQKHLQIKFTFLHIPTGFIISRSFTYMMNPEDLVIRENLENQVRDLFDGFIPEFKRRNGLE